MTVGEQIDEGIETLNAGGNQVDDTSTRLRWLRALQKAGDRAWTLRPMNRKLRSGTVTVGINDDGIGLMPTDFGSVGMRMRVYVNNERRSVDYRRPEIVSELREKNPEEAQFPDFYTLAGEDDGRLKIVLFRRNSGSLVLSLRDYQAKAPKFVDRPSSCVAAQGVAGAITAGTRTYKVTFVTADGETEGGVTSEAVTIIADKKISVTEIPISPVSTVTSRKLYRTIAAGEQHKLVATIADNVTTTYLDNTLDGDLGANVPTAVSAITGMERFPEDHHRTAILEAVIQLMARGEGDGRSMGEFSAAAITGFAAMWSDEKLDHEPRRAPRYGARAFRGW